MTRRTIFAVKLGLAAAVALPAFAEQQPMVHWDATKLSKPQFKVLMENNVQVKMRDGVSLSTDIYLPDAPGKFPTFRSARSPTSEWNCCFWSTLIAGSNSAACSSL